MRYGKKLLRGGLLVVLASLAMIPVVLVVKDNIIGSLELLSYSSNTVSSSQQAALPGQSVQEWFESQRPRVEKLILEARAERSHEQGEMGPGVTPLRGDTTAFDFSRYDFSGWELARKQFARGLKKRREREEPRDQSFQGLRDIIRASSDKQIKALRPIVDELERNLAEAPPNSSQGYVLGLVRDLHPLAEFIDHRTGIPASVVLAQAAVESGWGASNITILKSNILGIGRSSGPEQFDVAVDLGPDCRVVRVRAPRDTPAYQFNSIGDCMLYYAYVLLQSPDNEEHYRELREYVAQHREDGYKDPVGYRNRVVQLIAKGYHSNPEWYARYLKSMIDYLEGLEGERLLARGDRPQGTEDADV